MSLLKMFELTVSLCPSNTATNNKSARTVISTNTNSAKNSPSTFASGSNTPASAVFGFGASTPVGSAVASPCYDYTPNGSTIGTVGCRPDSLTSASSRGASVNGDDDRSVVTDRSVSLSRLKRKFSSIYDKDSLSSTDTSRNCVNAASPAKRTCFFLFASY